MNRLKWILVFLLALLIVPLVAHAVLPQGTPRSKPSDWMYYQGSCGSGGWSISAVTVPTAGDSKAFKAGPLTFTAASNNRLFTWGEQIRVQCTEDSLICEAMTTTATVVSAATCAEGCGYSSFDSASSRSGELNCHFVAADAPESFFKISKEGWLPWDPVATNMNVTARHGSCTVLGTATTLSQVGGGCTCSGASCANDAECDGTGGGTCVMGTDPKGVYLFVVALTNGGICRAEVCSQ